MTDLPFGVFNLNAAAVVYKNRLTVMSRKHLMSYEQEYDTWSVKEYEEFEDVITAFIVDGQLCTCIYGNENYSMVSYVDDHAWNNKKDIISDMLSGNYGFMA